jgi:protein-tyrosine-phosphatase
MAIFGEGTGISKYINRGGIGKGQEASPLHKKAEVSDLSILRAKRNEKLGDPRYRSSTLLQQEVSKLEEQIRQLGG